ncbi:DUF4232 domain-containing protein [Sanguibacter sp. A247]|uniref:DUF4232 domain-containing protein n=1 Tax=unclassified Sanguibacter TaxID=2645534 RepID=UPI003FD7BF06
MRITPARISATPATTLVMLVVIAGAATAAVTACAPIDADASSPETAPATVSAPAAPGSTSGPSEEDLPPGWDEPGDGPAPVPADALSPEQLLALVRLPATGATTAATCTEVDAHLRFVDAALGHRFGVLTVENTGGGPCELVGYPGLGGRGAWGSTFQWALEQRDPVNPDATQDPVRLAPGEHAVANLEWTGELAGAASERLALAVVQMAAETTPVAIVIAPDGAPGEPDAGFDIGMSTTVRIGPFALLARTTSP